MTDDTQVLYARRDGIHVLRFIGDVRCPLAPSVDRFVEELFDIDTPAGFVIDLTETRAIDSTILGVLGRIANRMRQRGGPRVTLLSTRPDITEVLHSMGFDEVFDLVAESAPDWALGEPVPVEEADRDSMVHTVIDAHRTLMALNEHNRELFRDLLAALERRENERHGTR